VTAIDCAARERGAKPSAPVPAMAAVAARNLRRETPPAYLSRL